MLAYDKNILLLLGKMLSEKDIHTYLYSPKTITSLCDMREMRGANVCCRKGVLIQESWREIWVVMHHLMEPKGVRFIFKWCTWDITGLHCWDAIDICLNNRIPSRAREGFTPKRLRLGTGITI